MLFAGAMALVAVVAAAGLVLDDRVLLGSPIWLKPFKFAVSFVLYAVTWAWMLSFQRRARRLAWWSGTVLTVAGSVEMLVIVGQTVRGRRSHFNVETPLDMTLYNVMGATIVALFIGQVILGVLALRERYADRASTTAIRLSVVISTIGLALGSLMLRNTSDLPKTIGAHSVGVPDGGPGMPVTGWSTTGGDLRIPHFVGMHALQLLPLFAILLGMLATRYATLRDVDVRNRLVWVAAGGYLGVVALVTWQALRGQPLTSPDLLTLAALAVLIGGTALAGRAAVRVREI
jgi:uncharacterized membrane protein YhaH (DUF805 family)